MLKEIITELNESSSIPKNVLKYLPKNVKKRVVKDVEDLEKALEVLTWPEESGMFGHYGQRDNLLEFNVKAHLDCDESDFPGCSTQNIEFAIEDYYDVSRKDLQDYLEDKYGVTVEGFDGRSGGYLLLGDWEE
jgi:hypothetical protein